MVGCLESEGANCCIALNLRSSDIFSCIPWSITMMFNHAKSQGQFLTFRARFHPNGKLEFIEILVDRYVLIFLLLVAAQSRPIANLLEGVKHLAGLLW